MNSRQTVDIMSICWHDRRLTLPSFNLIIGFEFELQINFYGWLGLSGCGWLGGWVAGESVNKAKRSLH